MYCLLSVCYFVLILGHFSELSFRRFPTPKTKKRTRRHSPFRKAPSEKRKIPAQNDRATTNPTQNPSTNVPVSFQLNSNATRALQPTTSGSLVSIIPDLNSVKALHTFTTTRDRWNFDFCFEPRVPSGQIDRCKFESVCLLFAKIV